MAASHDPTNANAVPGPSRHPYISSTASASAAPYGSRSTPSLPPNPPPPPALPKFDPSSTSVPPSAAPQQPKRSAEGPVIIPTVVGQDGVREVPAQFEHCEVEDLITLIASMLDRLIEHNDRIPLTSNSLTRFHSRAPPSIGVRDYLLRIARYTNVEPCCLLILLPYVDKVCARMSTFTISSLTVHRFIIAAISVGSKALSDAFCTNGRYARVGGVSVVEMNLLEKEFCEAIDWRLTTSGAVLAHYYTSLVRSHPSYRLSASPVLPAYTTSTPPTPSTASSASSAKSGSPAHPPAPAPSPADPSSASPNGHTPSSADTPSTSQSSASTSPSLSVSTSPNSSTSIDRSPALSSSSQRGRPRGRERGLSDAVLSPPQQPHSTPPLVPPKPSRRYVSASNLPSPAGGPTSPGSPMQGIVASAASAAAAAAGAAEPGSMLPPPSTSPAKRVRGRSTSSSSSSSSMSTGGAQGRFAPSPRLSGSGGGGAERGEVGGIGI
ncbi:hypothetical protein JCM1840_002810 [Sporobolomyces johnsonii]